MAEKQKIIKQMLDLQQKFIKIEQNGEFRADEYYDNEGDSELAKYKKTYDELAVKLMDMAHAEKGSQR